jgi:hypothetical protein
MIAGIVWGEVVPDGAGVLNGSGILTSRLLSCKRPRLHVREQALYFFIFCSP